MSQWDQLSSEIDRLTTYPKSSRKIVHKFSVILLEEETDKPTKTETDRGKNTARCYEHYEHIQTITYKSINQSINKSINQWRNKPTDLSQCMQVAFADTDSNKPAADTCDNLHSLLWLNLHIVRQRKRNQFCFCAQQGGFDFKSLI